MKDFIIGAIGGFLIGATFIGGYVGSQIIAVEIQSYSSPIECTKATDTICDLKYKRKWVKGEL